MVSNSTDDPGPATPRDELWFWLAAAAAIVVLLSLATVGVTWLALLGIVQVPAMLATLLAARAAVRLARRQPAALWIGRRAVLPGASALLVPMAALVLWTAAREGGWFGARLVRTESRVDTNATWSTFRAPGDMVVEPASPSAATGLEVVVGAGTLEDCIAEHVRSLSAAVPNLRVRGRLTVDIAPPWAPWPLWKSATRTCKVDVDLAAATAGGAPMAMTLRGQIELQGSWTMFGFATQRDFRTQIGSEIGRKLHDTLAQRLRDLAQGK